MRPAILNPLFVDPRSLPGIGDRLGKLVERLVGPHVVDLLWHLPTGVIDRRRSPPIADVQSGEIVTLELVAVEHMTPRGPRQPYRVSCRDAAGDVIDLVFFSARGDYLSKLLPLDQPRLVSGKIEVFQGRPQMAHPDHVVPPERRDEVMRVEPIYPLTAGLTAKPLAKAVGGALGRAPVLAEWLDPAFQKREGWPAWRDALTAAHAPSSEADLSPETPVRQRLAFDELLANQLAIALVRLKNRSVSGRSTVGDGSLRARATAALPFRLTPSQAKACEEIAADMAKPKRMARMLQGDVGSGKTIVAFMAMLAAVEAGAQATLMAPTELLARQHYATMEPLARAAGVRLALLTGRDRKTDRAATCAGLADGSIPLVVGTHALVQESVEFADLALAVVDEQHRFGVDQRLNLASKGAAADLLVMTATPIPRTLMLAVYGDLDASKLTDKPAGRLPVDTRTISLDRIAEVVEGVSRRVSEGARIYWVCPLVEESEDLDVAAAEERHRTLAERFPDKVGLIHGRMKGPERDRVMAAFSSGSLSILVATTVIEVGVDVPEATVMVVEHAERFGLAQLHQLRGRVGRGTERSSCLLLYGHLGETARARLGILRETDDGFRIAEEDLRLRGAGELLGTRQSGLPEMRLANLAYHDGLLQAARDDARLIVERDPDLQTPRGQALRTLLYLFERDAGIRALRSG